MFYNLVENLKLRKTILKANGASSRVENVVFDQLKEANDLYLEKLEKIQSFNRQSKKQVKTQTHQTEWLSEQSRLQLLAHKLEASAVQSLETILALSPEVSEIYSIISDNREWSADRQNRKDFMIRQLREMKELLRMSKQRHSTVDKEQLIGQRVRESSTAPASLVSKNSNSSSSRPDPSQIPSFPVAGKDPAAAIVANMLLNARKGLSERWTSLCGEEKRLLNALAGARVKIFSMLREDRMEEQDAALREQFEALIASSRAKDSAEGDAATAPDDLAEEQELQLQAALRDWLLKISLLDRQCKEAGQEREQERLLLGEKMGLPDPADPLGGWTDSDHDTFAKVYKKAQVTGMARKLMLEGLTLQLPLRSKEDILRHEEWYRAVKVLQQRSREAAEGHMQQRQQMISAATEELEQLLQAAREQRIREAEVRQMEARREQLHAKLMDLRAQQELRDAAESAAKQEELAALQLKQLEEAAAAAMERLEQREKVEQFRQQRAAALAEQRRLQQEQQEEASRRLHEEVEASKQRVVDRNTRLQQKEEDRRIAQEQKLAEEEMHRLKVLSMLAAEVPYWDAIQNASSKLDHVTASVKAHEYIPLSEDALGLARGHMNLNGFTDQQTIRDSRFRLVSALREAGLQHSAAAQQAVQKLFPRPQLAIHGII